MNNNPYLLKTNDFVSEDYIADIRTRNVLLHDFTNEYIMHLRAQVASGDYFALLATRLDQLSQELEKTNPDAHLTLERTIADLIFLHERYNITKKDHYQHDTSLAAIET